MTENSQIVNVEQYNGMDFRCVYDESSGRWMIPITDIAAVLKINRGNMSRSIKREIFDPHKGIVRLTTPGGYQQFTCITTEGMIGLFLPVFLARSKRKEVQDRIVEFRRWAVNTFQPGWESRNHIHIQQGTQNVPTQAIDIVNANLDIAEIAIKRSGVPKEVAHGYAWALAAEQTGMELNVYASFIKNQNHPEDRAIPKLALPDKTGNETVLVDPEQKADYERHFSLTKVAEIVKQPVDKVRNVLEKIGLIYHENGIWHLTKRGQEFGKNFMVYPGYPYSTHQRSYIKYNPDAIKVMRAYFGDDKTVQHPITKEENKNE